MPDAVALSSFSCSSFDILTPDVPLRRNPCVSCGACCAHFRVSFYWAEAEDVTAEGVPLSFVDDLGSFRRVMKGTNFRPPRCVALEGEIGKSVACSIYERRSSSCRDFKPSCALGVREEGCEKARAAHGLRPLTAEDWMEWGPRNRDPILPQAA